MKKTVLFVFLILLISTYCFAQDQNGEWIRFTSADKSYTVMFPGQPKIETETDAHTVTVMAVLAAPSKTVFISGYTDYDTMPDVQEELIADRDNFLKETKAKLLTSRQFDYERAANDRLPALIFTGEGNGRSFKGLVIVDKPRAYIFVLGGFGDISDSAQKFLDSARLYRVAK